MAFSRMRRGLCALVLPIRIAKMSRPSTDLPMISILVEGEYRVGREFHLFLRSVSELYCE